MNEINILFYKPVTFKGKIIEYFKDAKYSHVGIQLDEFHVFDIVGFDDVGIKHHNTNSKNYDKIELPITDEQYEKLYKHIGLLKNSKYDYLKAIGMGNDDSKYTCYELVQKILYNIGYIKNITYMTLPEELYRILIEAKKENIEKGIVKENTKCKILNREQDTELYKK